MVGATAVSDSIQRHKFGNFYRFLAGLSSRGSGVVWTAFLDLTTEQRITYQICLYKYRK